MTLKFFFIIALFVLPGLCLCVCRDCEIFIGGLITPSCCLRCSESRRIYHHDLLRQIPSFTVIRHILITALLRLWHRLSVSALGTARTSQCSVFPARTFSSWTACSLPDELSQVWQSREATWQNHSSCGVHFPLVWFIHAYYFKHTRKYISGPFSGFDVRFSISCNKIGECVMSVAEGNKGMCSQRVLKDKQNPKNKLLYTDW